MCSQQRPCVKTTCLNWGALLNISEIRNFENEVINKKNAPSSTTGVTLINFMMFLLPFWALKVAVA